MSTKIFIKAKPKSKKEYVKEIDSGYFEVAVKEVPEKGKANEAVRKAISARLRIPVSKIKIISGLKSKKKLVVVE